MNLDIEYLEQLTKLLTENNLTEMVLSEGDKAITIKRNGEFVERRKTPTILQIPGLPQPQAEQVVTSAQESKETSEAEVSGVPVVSPMVGTFYRSTSPDLPPLVEVGDVVSVGQTVCIVEAMKLMNEIETETSGKVVKICVEDGQPVEYGQVLMYID